MSLVRDFLSTRLNAWSEQITANPALESNVFGRLVRQSSSCGLISSELLGRMETVKSTEDRSLMLKEIYTALPADAPEVRNAMRSFIEKREVVVLTQEVKSPTPSRFPSFMTVAKTALWVAAVCTVFSLQPHVAKFSENYIKALEEQRLEQVKISQDALQASMARFSKSIPDEPPAPSKTVVSPKMEEIEAKMKATQAKIDAHDAALANLKYFFQNQEKIQEEQAKKKESDAAASKIKEPAKAEPKQQTGMAAYGERIARESEQRQKDAHTSVYHKDPQGNECFVRKPLLQQARQMGRTIHCKPAPRTVVYHRDAKGHECLIAQATMNEARQTNKQLFCK